MPQAAKYSYDYIRRIKNKQKHWYATYKNARCIQKRLDESLIMLISYAIKIGSFNPCLNLGFSSS